MRINILLPFRIKQPTGGIKIMYEYANRLAEKGHTITILNRRKQFQRYSSLMYPVARTLKEIEDFFTPFWFNFNKSCKVKYIRFINDKEIPDADATIYTWWELGYDVEKLSSTKGIKINLIQDYEIWIGRIDELHQSYNLPHIHNIVISNELKNKLKYYTKKESFLLPNAIDFEKFKITNSIETRNSMTICMMYHEDERKGCKYGLEALASVKKEIPELKVIMFSVYKKPDFFPDWIEYYRKPDNLCELYNQSAIFITSSIMEGWGLPAVESIACGCALICTNIGGHHEFTNQDTTLWVEPKQPQEMVEAIFRLIKNSKERISLAKSGNAFIQRFSWDKNVKLLEDYIQSLR